MVVSVIDEGATLSLGTPTKLFELRMPGQMGTLERYGVSMNAGASYDILPDGQQFVMSRGPDLAALREIILVQNFFEELKQLVPN